MYPTLTPPQVYVTCNYVGANADTVEKAVTIPLEEAINGVEGMRYISSSSTNSGTSSITTTFQTGYSLDIAAVDVQNRVASVTGRLPAAVNATGITISKANNNFVFGAGFFTRDGRYSHEFISNYLDVYVKDALKRVPGVGDVKIFGERKYAMRVWLDPVKLAARGLTATDVVNALVEQNVEIPAGQLGQPPSDSNQAFQIPVRVVGRLTSPDRVRQHHCQEQRQRAGASEGCRPLRGGSRRLQLIARIQRMSAQGIGVQQLSNANALDVDARAKAVLTGLSKSFPPGLEYAVAFDSTTVIGDSIREVLVTLAEAIVIVIAGHLPLPARLARHHHSRGDHSGFADRHLCLYQDLRILHQLAHALRHHAGHRTGGRRRHRGHRKRAAPHRHGALRSRTRPPRTPWAK